MILTRGLGFGGPLVTAGLGLFGHVSSGTSSSAGDDVPRRRSPHRGFDLERWKRERVDFDETIQQAYERLLRGPEPVRAEAEQIVAEFVATRKAESVDWAAISSDAGTMERLRALRAWQQHEREMADEEEAVAILLLH